jgi:hypothetical protein
MSWSSASRSSFLVRENVSNAVRAAATALSTSAALPREIRPIVSSVAGLMTSNVFGVTGSTQPPPM